MLNWLKGYRSVFHTGIDIHSHLLPGIDDGVKSVDESLALIRYMMEQGYHTIVTTPHIYTEVFPNTPEIIREKYQLVKEALVSNAIDVRFEVAAEYYVDEYLLSYIQSRGELLTFDQKYILLETSFYAKPMIFDQVIFELKSLGLQPILAHPERYEYLHEDISWLKSIRENGVLLQGNLMSLAGVYGKLPQQLLQHLIRLDIIDFLGSDLHRSYQLKGMTKALKTKISKSAFKNEMLYQS